MTVILDKGLTERELNQALLHLKNYGVCSAQRTLGLLELEYISGSSQWFKPIPWAMSFFHLTALGKQQALNVEIDDLAATKPNKLIDKDPFQPSEIDAQYFGKLIFTEARIRDEIAKGNHLEIGRAEGSDISLYHRHVMHPEYFPLEQSNA